MFRLRFKVRVSRGNPKIHKQTNKTRTQAPYRPPIQTAQNAPKHNTEMTSGSGCQETVMLGIYGCRWVIWGAGTRGNTKTRQGETKMIAQGVFFVPMAGEISPKRHIYVW